MSLPSITNSPSVNYMHFYLGEFIPYYYFLFLVLIMKKFDCVKERKVAIPDRSDESTGEALAKFTDYVSAKFDCPRIVKNGK